MAKIHPTAIVDESAVIADNVEIGPYCIVEADVKIGSGCKLMAHSMVMRYTSMGENNIVHPNACIGNIPQDFGFKDVESFVEIGSNNTFREGATVHRGTGEGTTTVVGNSNYFMTGAHVGHNSRIGNNNIMVNFASAAGHVQMADNCLISGLCGIHQFCRVGRFAVMSGGSMTSLDLPPFMIADGRNGLIRGVNMVGLKRNGFSRETIKVLKSIYNIFYKENLKGSDALLKIEAQYSAVPEAMEFVEFVRASKRGVNQIKGVSRRS